MNLEKAIKCPIAEDCLFYTKEELRSPEEQSFFMEYCMRGGGMCGLKKNWDMDKYKLEDKLK